MANERKPWLGLDRGYEGIGEGNRIEKSPDRWERALSKRIEVSPARSNDDSINDRLDEPKPVDGAESKPGYDNLEPRYLREAGIRFANLELD